MPITFSLAKSLYVSPAEGFLSEIAPSIMWPTNLTAAEWMERIENDTSG